MSFFTADNVQRITGGRWIHHPPARAAALVGVGTDTRVDLRGRAFFALRGETHDGHEFLPQASAAGAALLVIDRDLAAAADAVPTLRVQSARAALGDLARAYRATLSRARVIAITGSAGKTTTKHLLNEVLKRRYTGTCAIKSFNNDIGVPLAILSAQPTDQYLLLEAGTNAPGEIAALASIIQPEIGLITSIGRSHLEGLDSVAGVAREKLDLLLSLPREGLAIVPVPCTPLDGLLSDVSARLLRVGPARDADLQLTGRGRYPGGWWFEVDRDRRFRVQLPGRHNAINSMLVIAAARELGLCDDEIAAALEVAAPPDMRMTRCTVNEIEFFNDAYNANPDSMMASLESFGEAAQDSPRRVAVLGDMLELGRESDLLHREVGRFLGENRHRLGISAIALVGRSAIHYLHGLDGAFAGGEILELNDLNTQSAARALRGFLSPGDAVLLKGSRRLGLERIVEGVRTALADSGPPGLSRTCSPEAASIS